MTKEQQIATMIKIIDEYFEVYCTTPKDIAESLYEAGFRKVGNFEVISAEALLEEVRTKTAKKIFKRLSEIKLFDGYSEFICTKKELYEIFKNYGVEIEK